MSREKRQRESGWKDIPQESCGSPVVLACNLSCLGCLSASYIEDEMERGRVVMCPRCLVGSLGVFFLPIRIRQRNSKKHDGEPGVSPRAPVLSFPLALCFLVRLEVPDGLSVRSAEEEEALGGS